MLSPFRPRCAPTKRPEVRPFTPRLHSLESRVVPATFTVHNLNDAGVGSLRDAVAQANYLAGADTIEFLPGFSGTITLTTSEVAISDAVTISGPGAGLLTISGNKTSRIFNTSIAAAATGINLSGMTLTGGTGFGPSGYKIGGGAIVMGNESLTITDCVFSANLTPESGGAVKMIEFGGTLTAITCTFANNHAQFSGGAISSPFAASATTIVMLGCTVTGNYARNGGGVYARGDLFIESCTFSKNWTTGGPSLGGAGGIAVRGASGTTGTPTIRNSTISGNTASGSGGGLYLYNTAGTVLVQNCTITANTAAGAFGGGIARSGTTNTIALESSIIAGNSASKGGPDLFTAGTVNATTSLIGSVAGVTTFNPDPITSSLLGKAAQLALLANNGGPTQTHALLPGSPAIDTGSNSAGLTTDQRGFVRTAGASPDVGAFEVQPTATVTAVVINGGAAQRSRVTSITVTFDVAVSLSPNTAAAFQLKRQSDNALVALDASANSNTVTLAFSGGPVESNSLADGRYTLSVLAAQLSHLDGNGDGTPGDDYLLIGDPTSTPHLFRLFGDADGDGDVDAQDYGAFRGAFGSAANLAFDFDGDVDSADYGQFRGRFGAVV